MRCIGICGGTRHEKGNVVDATALDAFDRGEVYHQIPACHTGHCEGKDAEQNRRRKGADPGSWP